MDVERTIVKEKKERKKKGHFYPNKLKRLRNVASDLARPPLEDSHEKAHFWANKQQVTQMYTRNASG